MTYTILNPHVELGALLQIAAEHAEEMYPGKHNFDINQLCALVAAGLVRIFVARDETGICGYCMYIINRDLFLAHLKQAECVAIYIRPEKRGYAPVSRLMRLAETWLKEKDQVQKITSTTSNNERMQNFYARLGYTVVNTQIAKEL